MGNRFKQPRGAHPWIIDLQSTPKIKSEHFNYSSVLLTVAWQENKLEQRHTHTHNKGIKFRPTKFPHCLELECCVKIHDSFYLR